MPSLKILCLHGAGSSEDILESQMRTLAYLLSFLTSGVKKLHVVSVYSHAPGGLTHNLEGDNSASFVYVGGEIGCGPGPSIEHIYDGPYYVYYAWPRRLGQNDEQSVQEAYNLLDDIIDKEGPFDGILGFSHGGALAFAFLLQHARKHPYDPMPVRCAIFICAMPPFRLGENDELTYDQTLADQEVLRIPSLHVVGKSDFVLKHPFNLHAMCDPTTATLIVHSRGHEIPRDKENVLLIGAAVRALGHRAMFG